MDRNREARRVTNMATPTNGLSSSRRRHRSSSLRDSPDEDGGVEVPEPGRLRDRGVVKKDRGDRDRDRDRERDRERERSSRSKRRRENRMLIHHVNTGSNRDDGDDTSEESVNDEEEDEDDAGNGGGLRMLPPPPASQSTAAAAAVTSNHHNHNPYSQQLHHRKSFPSSGNKVFRASAAAPPPAWKAADEMIGVSVPRKARSASTKRSHEWSSGGVVGGGGGTELIHRQSSTSPVRLASSAASPAPVAPPSPSSSNVSVRKKMKANGGSKPRPPKSSSKSSSSNPEELEIEIAEVLYGLMTQSQAPSKKEIPPNDSTNKSSSEIKSKVSSPISNSTSLSTVAPKRKRPRQVSENPFSVRNSPVSSSIKTEIDHHQHHQSPKTDISSPYLENSSPASAVAAENGVSSFGFTTLPGHHASSALLSESSVPLHQPVVEEEGKCGVGVVLTKEEVKESPAVGLNDGNSNPEAVITTATATTATNLKQTNPETESQKEEKFEIDLMAPPPQQRTSQESDVDIDFSNHKQMPLHQTSKTKEDEKLKIGKEETEEQKKSKAGTMHETGESSKQAMSAELHLDFEKPNKDSSNRSLHQALKHQHSSTKSEAHTEKTAQPSSLPMPMSVANWPPMGYVAPLQGVISMDGSTMPSAPVQPLFSQPRPKRCATHCYIARNIHYLQQFMKINPFWPAASGSAAPMYGTKHSIELHANIPQSMQDKGQPVGIFPGHTTGKDTKSSQSTAVPDAAHRKPQQQVLLQQGMPPVTPNNILHGPAFIFPFNQQQAVAASASVRPGSSKLNSSTTAGGLGAASGAANSASVSSSTTAAVAPALSFNYPNMSANETQYLAIVQNHPYAFPIPAVGAPNYRGNHPHAQAMPLFNGSFYSSQMMHPPQNPQPPQQAPPPIQSQQTHQNSSGSTSSSQKHLQAQQRQQKSGAAVNGGGSGNGGGMHISYPPPPKNRSQQLTQQIPPAQARHLENEVTGGEDSPSTADSRVSRAATNTMNVYGPNFAMPVHSQNFALMNPQAAAAAAGANNSNDKKLQQQSQQQVLKRVGAESSSMPPQTFAMSFAPMNGTTGISSMAQNHTFFQSLPESSRQSYHHMMTSPAVAAAASSHHSEQKKDFKISEEASRTTGHDSSNVDDDRKSSAGLTTKSGQSIAFSRPDLATDAPGSSAAAAISGASVIDSSSSRNINLGSNNRSTRSQISTSVPGGAQSSHHLHAQFQQQQQILQLQKQQQQHLHVNARSKNPPPSSNGSGYSEHLVTSSSAMALMFPNSLSSFPLQTSNTNSSPVQSPQWRNSARGPTTSQVSSSLASTTTSSLKNHHQTHQPQQQQSSRSHTQSHTQISFGAAAAGSQKLSAQMQLPQQQQQQQQQQNHNPNSNSGNQCPSPPMLVGSPTTSLSSSQPPKNTVGTQRSSPSILGNPHNSNSAKSQQQQQQQQQQQLPQQLHKQTLTQQQAQAKAYAQMMYSHPYMAQQQQPQAQQHSVGPTAASGYYLPRKQQLTQQQAPSSTAMLSLCPPVTLANTTTSDPAKAIAAATSNMKGGVGVASQQGILHAAQYGGSAAAAAPSSMPAGFPQYTHSASVAAVQVKPAEQKQPAGNDN